MPATARVPATVVALIAPAAVRGSSCSSSAVPNGTTSTSVSQGIECTAAATSMGDDEHDHHHSDSGRPDHVRGVVADQSALVAAEVEGEAGEDDGEAAHPAVHDPGFDNPPHGLRSRPGGSHQD